LGNPPSFVDIIITDQVIDDAAVNIDVTNNLLIALEHRKRFRVARMRRLRMSPILTSPVSLRRTHSPRPNNVEPCALFVLHV
jgi:hypothetical protein